MTLADKDEAAYALDYGLDREGLSPEVQREYDRLKAERARLSWAQPRAERKRWQPERAEADGMAIAALVLGIVATGITSILAVVFGGVSVSRAKRDGQRPSLLAAWGLGLGIAGIVLWIILGIVIGAALAHHGTSAPCDFTNPAFPNC